jgi:hypothetical protein
MLLIADPPAIEETQPLLGVDSEPRAQGVEGRQMQQEVERVWNHWIARSAAAQPPARPALDDLPYTAPGPHGSFVVRVQYELRGKGRPMPYQYSPDEF